MSHAQDPPPVGWGRAGAVAARADLMQRQATVAQPDSCLRLVSVVTLQNVESCSYASPSAVCLHTLEENTTSLLSTLITPLSTHYGSVLSVSKISLRKVMC